MASATDQEADAARVDLVTGTDQTVVKVGKKRARWVHGEGKHAGQSSKRTRAQRQSK